MERERPSVRNLARDYNSFHNSLRDSAYSHLEKGIVYTGLALGMFAPVAVARYGLFPRTDSLAADLGYWAASVVMNVMSTAIVKGFPLVYTGGVGAVGGNLTAFGLKKWRERRMERKSNLPVDEIND